MHAYGAELKKVVFKMIRGWGKERPRHKAPRNKTHDVATLPYIAVVKKYGGVLYMLSWRHGRAIVGRSRITGVVGENHW